MKLVILISLFNSKIIHLDDIVGYADCYCSFVIVIVYSGG